MTRIVLTAVVLALLTAARASASCVTSGQGPCSRFWTADAVFVAKVLSGVPPPDDWSDIHSQFQVIVVEAFRGVSLGERLTVLAFVADHGVEFYEDGEFFVYASRSEEGKWFASGCGTSVPLSRADDDLEYARSVTDHGSAARVYGRVYQHEELQDEERDDPSMAGVAVRVMGANFSAETFTDERGEYSIALPGAGAYKVEVLPPEGFANPPFHGSASFEVADRRACYRESFPLQSNGRVRGRVVDVNGQPVADLVVRISDSNRHVDRFGKTDASGGFEIGPLSKGSYRVVAVPGGADLSFETTQQVRVEAGQITELSRLIAVMDDELVKLVVEVKGGGEAGKIYVFVTQGSSDERLGEAAPAAPDGMRLLVRKNELFQIEAASLTHEAKAVVRAKSPETVITLTLRPQRQ